MNTTIQKVVLDVYPIAETPHFDRAACGVATCWSPKPVTEAHEMATREMHAEGWRVADTITRAELADHELMAHERRWAERAHETGLLCSVEVIKRVAVDDVWPLDLAAALRAFYTAIRDQQLAWVLYSEQDQEHGTVNIGGHDGLPLWLMRNDLERYRSDWPEGFEPRSMGVSELDTLLRTVHAQSELVALCLEGPLVTFHPLALADELIPCTR